MAEMLATVGMVGILGTISITLFLGTHENVKTQRLHSDIEALNRSVTAYRANGGTLAANLTAHEVISKLKTVGDADTQRTLPGYRAACIDGRFTAYNVSASQRGPRAVWDATGFQFNLAEGVDGVLFEMLDQNTADTGVEEARGVKGPAFSKTSNWVWDFAESTAISTLPSTPVVTSDTDLTVSPSYANPVQLAPPVFSIPGGSYPLTDYPLELALTNPPSNPVGTPIRYSIDSAPWQEYTGTPILIPAGAQVVAYADRNNSKQIYSSYTTTQLYQVDSTAPLNFAGQSPGQFLNAVGGEDMVASYVQNGLDGTFEWGDGADGVDSGSQLSFYAASFLDVEEQSWFRLGGLEYFNSTIWAGTEATNVDLELSIAFSAPSVMETFNFSFALENTANEEGNTADQNADYVRINTPNSAFSTTLNGNQYEFQLQFGYLGSDGFARVDEFHVHEGAQATADIWGYFVPTSN